MSHSRVIILLAFFLLLPLSTPPTEAAQFSTVGWVGLWNKDMTDWAENGNLIKRLCPKTMSKDSFRKCRREYLTKKSWTIRAYKNPAKVSEVIGEIILTVKPGSPFMAAFKFSNKKIRGFEPDLFDQDWGYGPLFHQTVLEIRGDWTKIPIRFLDTPVWINTTDSIEHLDIINITEGRVYILNSRSIMITEIEEDVISYRSEQPSDMWCKEGDPPKPKESETERIRIEELYDSHQHLLLDIKYKRGC